VARSVAFAEIARTRIVDNSGECECTREAAAAMTKMRLELLGYDALPLEGMYHSQRHDVLTPQSSPESRSVRQEQRSSAGSVGSAISQSDMYPLDQPTFELDHLPLHIPTILHCKCRRTMHREIVDYLSSSSSLRRASATLVFSWRWNKKQL